MEKNIEQVLKTNAKKKKLINQAYDPVVGIGCYGERAQLEISDAPYPIIHVPVAMMKENLVKQVDKHGSIEKMYKAHKLAFDEDELMTCWIDICEIRIKYDVEYYFAEYETIEHGEDGDLIPFVMNRAQRAFHADVMKDIEMGVPIRKITLKARQHGISTYIEMLFSWIQKVKKRRWNSVVCAHLQEAAKTIRGMYTLSMEHMMPIGGVQYKMTAFDGTSNIKEIKERQCKITVGTAEKPESVRSQNPKLAHFSEVAFYPDTDKKKTSSLLSSIIGPMKYIPWTAVFYESTANGIGDYFETEYSRAKKGETAYTCIFLPWFYNQSYAIPIIDSYIDSTGKRRKGTINDFIKSMSPYEWNLFNLNDECSLEKVNWYRAKAGELPSASKMKQEYPSDDIEAFQDSGSPVFRSEEVEALRINCKNPEFIGDLVGDALPQIANIEPARRKDILKNIRFVNNPDAMEAMKSSDVKRKVRMTQNKLKIWRMPSPLKIRHRYLVVFDPQKGISDAADWGVIAVFDRLPMMSGERPELVAQFRGHIDKDISIWIATQIATFFNDALLVVESNVYDSVVKEDDAEMIFETIKFHYSNLYTRTDAEKIKEGFPAKWGFNMNRKTKPMVVTNFIGVVREDGYIERDGDALNEARTYEQQTNGSYAAKQGKHDDILDTRMIGLHVCYTMPMPSFMHDEKENKARVRRSGGMSDI